MESMNKMNRQALRFSAVVAGMMLVIACTPLETSTEIIGPLIKRNITAIAVAPGGNPVYVGTFESGVFRLDADTGEAKAINDGLESLFIRSLAMDPVNASRLYVSSGKGVFRTEDTGEHWVKRDLGVHGINEIWISSHNSDFLLAQEKLGGVFRSNDGGEQWHSLRNPVTDHGGNVGTEIVVTKDESTIFVAKEDVGIVRSRNGGQTWKDVSPRDPTGVMALSADQSVLYASSWEDVSSPGEKGVVVYRSLDDGDTWEGLEYTPIVTEHDWFPWGITLYLLPDPDVPNVLYATASDGSFYTTDGGMTWQPFTDLRYGILSGLILAIDPDRSRLYVATVDGLFITPTPDFPTAAEANSWGSIKSLH